MNLKEYIVGKTVLFHKACYKSRQKSKEKVQMSLIIYIYIYIFLKTKALTWVLYIKGE